MRRFGALLIILATLATTLSVLAEDWTLANGKTYKNVVIVAQEDDGVRVTYDGGVGKFPYYELSDDLLLRLGQDPATQAIKRAAVLKQQAADALQAQQDAAAAAELKKEQAEAAAINAALNPQAQSPTSTPGQNSATATTPGQPQSPSPSHPSAPGTANATTAPAPVVQPNQAAPPPVNPPPAPVAVNPAASPEEQQQQSSYPNSKFQYDESADVSYLDSPAITIVPILADAAPTTGAAAAPSPNASIYLRVVTEGRRAESPDEVEGVFTTPTPLKPLETDNKVIFLVDGAYIPTEPLTPTGDPSTDAPSPTQVTFFLTPEHMKTLLLGKKVNVNVGSYNYRIDDNGLATFQAFLGDFNHLPPASTSFVREYHRFVNRLPSIITMISTTCEYIILGAFALVMMASIAAFVMGLTRFIKM